MANEVLKAQTALAVAEDEGRGRRSCPATAMVFDLAAVSGMPG